MTRPSISPRPIRWTWLAFHRLASHGLFEGRGAMLVDGAILESGQVSPQHAATLELTSAALRIHFASGWVVRTRMPLTLDEENDPQPDLAVVPGSPRDYMAHPTNAALVVEVADTSFDFDSTENRLLYAKAGIRDYWIVDINGRRLLVYPRNGDYPPPQAFVKGDSVSPLAAPAATVRVADLLI